MCEFERVIGILVVIEGGFRPFFFLVTSFALFPEAVGMDVPDRMTAGTLLWRILVLFSNVAGIAIYLLV